VKFCSVVSVLSVVNPNTCVWWFCVVKRLLVRYSYTHLLLSSIFWYVLTEQCILVRATGRWCCATGHVSYTHTYNRFTALFPELPGWAGVRRNLLPDFMVQGKITAADIPTIQLGATLSRLISNSPPSLPIFTLDALPAATLPLYPGLGQAPNMLACIPSDVVTHMSYTQ